MTAVAASFPHAPRPAGPTPALPCRALFLDFDGVILQSAALKTRAFADVYAGADPALLARIVDYVDEHGGVTRTDKFAHIERAFFGRPGDAAAVGRLAQQFRRRVLDAVLACDFVPGARRLLDLAHGRVDLHVVSGTPHDELVETVAHRGLAPLLTSVHGAPPHKRVTFERLLREHGYAPGTVVAVGDAPTEFVAARALGIPFIAVVPEGAPRRFPDDVPVVANLEPLPRMLGLA